MKDKNRFNIRGFVSLVIAIMFVVLLFSGFVVYIAPKCWIANWIDWGVAGLGKHDWEAIHTVFALLFIVAIIAHIVYNWNTFISYIAMGIKKGVGLKREFLYALCLVVLVFIATWLAIPPFSWVVDFGERQTLAWEKGIVLPPFAGAELATVEELGVRIGEEPEEILQLLRDRGLRVEDKKTTIRKIADRNGLSPSEVFGMLPVSKRMQDPPMRGGYRRGRIGR